MEKMICLTGRSSVGKTTLAHHISQQFEIPAFSMGDYQREHFARKGYGGPHDYHMKLGINETYFELWPKFVEGIASRVDGKSRIVVESVYTLDFLRLLEREFQVKPLLVCISAPDQVRLSFFMKKHQASEQRAREELVYLDCVKVNVGLPDVEKNADVAVVNDSSVEKLLRTVDGIAAKYLRG